MASIGQVLNSPEAGWQRILCQDTNTFQYIGDWAFSWGSYYANGTTIYNCGAVDGSASINFNFTGTKFRIIGSRASSYTNSIKVYVDGELVNEFNPNNSSITHYVLEYESGDLTPTQHSCRIVVGAGGGWAITGIDYIQVVNIGDILTAPQPEWKRIDNTDSNIKYTGTWTYQGSSSAYLGNDTYTTQIGATIKFKFIGNKLRIIAPQCYVWSSKVQITIDGVTENFSHYDTSSGTYQKLVYQKLNLSNTVHDVTITNIDGAYSGLDAIDINSDGYLLPLISVGDQLNTPESGWKRYDDTDNYFQLKGKWDLSIEPGYPYNGTIHNCGIDGSEVNFRFIGQKLRIISPKYPLYSSNISVYIDNIKAGTFNPCNSLIYNILQFDTILSEYGEHSVKIIIGEGSTTSGTRWGFDAIDIDDTGKLLPPKYSQSQSWFIGL